MTGIRIAPRAFDACPHFMDAHVESKLGKRPPECGRMPIRMFKDPLCDGCPLLVDHCEYYRRHARTSGVFEFCPICGSDLMGKDAN